MKAASAQSSTKVFGMQLGASRGKLALLGLLLAVAIVFLIRNLTSDDNPGSSSSTPASAAQPAAEPATEPQPVAERAELHASRRRMIRNENSTLRLRPIDARRGDIDPTLRLDLLSRLQSLPFAPGSRSLFDAGTAPMTQEALNMKAVRIPTGPKPGPITPPVALAPPIPPIPLKFYGFIQPKGVPGPNRGFFLEGDNIFVASEGQVLLKKYKIVQLSANAAVVEDTDSNHRQTLALVPEAQNAM